MLWERRPLEWRPPRPTNHKKEGAKMNEPAATIEAIDILQLLKYLPHRYPFLLVDRIIEARGDEFGIGVKNVSVNEPHFQGHFPGRPVMPGVLLIEGMAQTAGALCIRARSSDGQPQLVYFISIDKAKFRKPVLPGDRVEFHMTKTNRRRNMWWYSGRAMVDGALVCEAEIAAMIAEEDPSGREQP
jgi:3-hydroxyacyl-[acyl-carrier-protein] dehydratase